MSVSSHSLTDHTLNQEPSKEVAAAARTTKCLGRSACRRGRQRRTTSWNWANRLSGASWLRHWRLRAIGSHLYHDQRRKLHWHRRCYIRLPAANPTLPPVLQPLPALRLSSRRLAQQLPECRWRSAVNQVRATQRSVHTRTRTSRLVSRSRKRLSSPKLRGLGSRTSSPASQTRTPLRSNSSVLRRRTRS